MKQKIKKLTTHPLIAGSATVFLGSFFVNGLNYLFNLVMGRVLSVSEYGVLISLISLISFFTIFQTALTNLFTKFSAEYSARNDLQMQKTFMYSGLKASYYSAGVFFVFLLISFIPFSIFLKIPISNPSFLFLVFLAISTTILLSFPIGVLQGELKFLKVVVINIVAVLAKICAGLILTLSGFGVLGGLIAVFLSFFTSYIFSVVMVFRKLSIKTHLRDAKLHMFTEFKKESLTFLLASLGITIIQSTDVIFARHYLSDVDAGRFAALSLMGRAIFYITSPIYLVFFPLIIHKREKKQKTAGTLLLAGFIVLGCNLFFSMTYFLFPGFIIKLFFPTPEYQALIPSLGFYSLFVSIFSVAFLLHNYLLSVNKTGVFKINWLAGTFFILLLVFFHDTIQHIIFSLILSSLLLLVLLFVYYFRNE